MRANEQTDEGVAQYLRPNSWLFSPTVLGSGSKLWLLALLNGDDLYFPSWNPWEKFQDLARERERERLEAGRETETETETNR